MESLIDNKQKILDTALDLFSEYGYESVGVQLLAEKSGITKPTLYHYFGNKEGVFRELLKVYYDKLDALLAKASVYSPNVSEYSKDVYPVLLKVANTYFKFSRKNEKFYRMVLCALFSPPTSKTNEIAVDLNGNQYAIIQQMFLKIANAHPNMKGREKRLCYTFVGMINTYIGMWYGKSETLSDKTTQELVAQFMHGIFS